MFNSILTESLSVSTSTICIITAVILGVVIAFVHSFTNRYSKNFIISLAVLPAIVEIIIMLVNGNLGTSVAVAGAFTLVRFRSIPGTSREIISIFLAMAIGLACGMGYILFAIYATIILSVLIIILSKTKFGEKKETTKLLKIVVPENVDYVSELGEVMDEYAKEYRIIKVKTINMGSMYEVTYNIELAKEANQKEFLDKLRIRNSNLNISLIDMIEECESL